MYLLLGIELSKCKDISSFQEMNETDRPLGDEKGDKINNTSLFNFVFETTYNSYNS